MLQFLLTTSSRQLIENPCINTPMLLDPFVFFFLLNAPLGTRSTWHITAILNETVQYNSLDFYDAR